MVFQNTETQQQAGIRVLPCYDEIIAFLKDWFPHIPELQQKPIFRIDRYSGSNAAYQKITEWTVTAFGYGRLKEISLCCDNYPSATWWVQISGQKQEGFVLQTGLSLPYSDLRLQPEQKVTVWVKSDGVNNINADASIIGVEIMT